MKFINKFEKQTKFELPPNLWCGYDKRIKDLSALAKTGINRDIQKHPYINPLS